MISGKLLLVLSIAAGYAVVRYVVLGDTAPDHLPLYVGNKAVALASVIWLLLAAWSYAAGRGEAARRWGRASLHGAYVHVLMSFILLSPAYYPDFFHEGRLRAAGELTLLFGVAALYLYWRTTRRHEHVERPARYKTFAAAAIGLHLAFMGAAGWVTPSSWHGSLPPISLLGFVAASAALVVYLRRGPA